MARLRLQPLLAVVVTSTVVQLVYCMPKRHADVPLEKPDTGSRGERTADETMDSGSWHLSGLLNQLEHKLEQVRAENSDKMLE